MKPIVTITIGISASGKSTFAKEQCRINSNTIRLNRDDMRSALFGVSLQEYFDTFNDQKENENLITSLTWKLVNQAIKQGKNVILDNTHLEFKYINSILNNIDEDCDFKVEWFFIDPETAIERDKLRETVVGEVVIKKQYEKFINFWDQRADIDIAIRQRKQLNFEPVVQDESLPKAVVFDIDGTLALMDDNGRSPYEWNRVDEDSINEPVDWLHSMVDWYGCDDLLERINIIICTGRDGKAEAKTKEWLEKNRITYDEFYIRKSGDCRKDSIVKREFLEDIITKYNVLFTLDDRNQVVKMWRKSGIPCFQVAEGDF